jgi:hypothetical protein
MLQHFYESLPSLSAVSSFYIPGYTEALSFFSGVRVIPHSSFIEGTDMMVFKKYFFALKALPVYFIPIFRKRKCYGFVLRGAEVKFTPRFCTNFLLPGCERIENGDIVFIVEGLKDSGPLLMLGVKTIPCLTSAPSVELLRWLKLKNCKVYIIPDWDEHLKEHVQVIRERLQEAGYVEFRKDFFIHILAQRGVKCDLGDFFCPVHSSEQGLAIFNIRQIISKVKELEWISVKI